MDDSWCVVQKGIHMSPSTPGDIVLKGPLSGFLFFVRAIFSLGW